MNEERFKNYLACCSCGLQNSLLGLRVDDLFHPKLSNSVSPYATFYFTLF